MSVDDDEDKGPKLQCLPGLGGARITLMSSRRSMLGSVALPLPSRHQNRKAETRPEPAKPWIGIASRRRRDWK